MELRNKINKETLKAQILQDSIARTTISFYKYHNLQDPKAFRDKLFIELSAVGVLGRIYVAKEGINAQINVPTSNFETFKSILYGIDWLNGVRLNIAADDNGKSFYVLKIKVRDKIVADGLDENSYDVTACGEHVKADKFNQLVEDPQTILVDMRNHYESEVGHFKGAITPDVDTFRDSLPIISDMIKDQKDKNLLMYCTGGIRCEKASAYFKSQGFDNVFQLEGGIIKYFHDVKENGLDNKFIGKNFVFDERLGERITDDVIAKCHQCGASCDTHTNCANVQCNLLFIQCDNCKSQMQGCCSEECKDYIQLPEDIQKENRKGKDDGIRIFTKGRLKK